MLFNGTDTVLGMNCGLVALRQAEVDDAAQSRPHTVIVSGVGRSGTSMIARVLGELGLYMGITGGLPVHEDRAISRALFQFDYDRLRRLVSERDARYQRWGFKFPSLQNHIFPPQLSYFRNPRLIIVMRDMLATANRAYISDQHQNALEETLVNVTQQTSHLVDFIVKATCPTLLISYEKFVVMPDMGISAITAFCGMTITDDVRRAALGAIEPNNPQYIALFHSRYKGHLDTVQDGMVLGWCADQGDESPVEVELVADDTVLASTRADIYRPDLLTAGIGLGFHGFRFDLSSFVLAESAVLEVRTMVETHVISGSGRCLSDFPER